MSWSPESLYAVKKIKSRGKGLVARRNLDPDNCIIEEPSDMAILDNSSLEDTCDNCFAIRGRPMSYPTHNPYNADEQERTKFLRCGGCGVVKYCNQVRLRLYFA